MPAKTLDSAALDKAAGRRGDRHRRGPAPGGSAQDRGVAGCNSQQRKLLDHRHRREGRHSVVQRRRRAHAGLRGRRNGESDNPGPHFRSAGSDSARRGIEPRAVDHDYAGVRGAGLQGFARNRGHLRADLHPQGRQPLSGDRVGHGAARRRRQDHRLSVDRHRQFRAQAGRRATAVDRGEFPVDGGERDRLRHRHAGSGGARGELEQRSAADQGLQCGGNRRPAFFPVLSA